MSSVIISAPTAPCRFLANEVVQHAKSGKLYRIDGAGVWVKGVWVGEKGTTARAWFSDAGEAYVGVTGMRNGKKFGPWRSMKLSALCALAPLTVGV